MIWPIVLMAVLSLNSATAAEAYKCKGKNGETIFSDQPCAKNAELIELKEPQTFSAQPANTEFGGSDNQSAKPQSIPKEIKYRDVRLVSPIQGEVFEGDDAVVTIQLASTPALDENHRAQLQLNGVKHGEATRQSQWALRGLERGDYVARIAILDKKGRELASASASFVIVKHLAKKKP